MGKNATIPVKQSLSLRLFRWVMLTAIIAGCVLSVLQILLDARRAGRELDTQALALLEVVKEPATQAVYSIDASLGAQVIEGLFKQRLVRGAVISHSDGSTLVEKQRPLIDYQWRWLTDAVFDQTRQYSLPLEKTRSKVPEHFGDIILNIDTSVTAESFLERSLIVFLTGLAKALILGCILYVVYSYILTRPISELISSLLTVDPRTPGKNTIPVPKGHEQDELGVWVNSANLLLSEISESQSRRQAAEARALQLSQNDALTGLPNRRQLRVLLQKVLHAQENKPKLLAIFCCGLDDFKSINDQFSYNTGDKLLRAYAQRMSAQHQNLFIASRLSGDQFVLVLQVSDESALIVEAEKLLAALSQPYVVGDQRIAVRSTIGISRYPADGTDCDKLLQKAEHTMMLGKSVKRNHYCFYEESVDTLLRERKQLERDLSTAITNQELHLVYQPQIDLKTNEIIGAEALLRWNHPEKGLIRPDIFIALAENNGQIAEIGKWVIDAVCKQVKQWQSQGLEVRIAINVSAIQLNNPLLAGEIVSAMTTARIKPDAIEVEVTETGVMLNPDRATETLRKLQQFGIHISVDDFGTGYSSLSYLKKLPISTLKIDKQFIDDLLSDKENATIVNAMIQLGHNLNYKVVAEGVETKQQHEDLKLRNCDIAQGYLYAKPMKPKEFSAFLQTHYKLSKATRKDDSNVI